MLTQIINNGKLVKCWMSAVPYPTLVLLTLVEGEGEKGYLEVREWTWEYSFKAAMITEQWNKGHPCEVKESLGSSSAF